MARSDRFTELGVRPLRYVDFSGGFEKNPVTGDLALVTDVEAVKQAVRNLVLTQRGERFFQPTLGCLVHDLLFEPFDAATRDAMTTTIEQAIAYHEPRARLISIDYVETTSGDGVNLKIVFSVTNIPEPVSLSIFLKRPG